MPISFKEKLASASWRTSPKRGKREWTKKGTSGGETNKEVLLLAGKKWTGTWAKNEEWFDTERGEERKSEIWPDNSSSPCMRKVENE